MINLPDRPAIEAALRQPLAPLIHAMIAKCFSDAVATDLADQTHILVIQARDTKEDIADAIGFFPGVDSQPDWLEAREGYWERVFTVGNSVFAFMVFILDAKGMDADLLALCRAGREA